MPVHHVPRASLHEDLQDIERHQGERVLRIVPDALDSSFVYIYTEPQGLEYRDGAA